MALTLSSEKSLAEDVVHDVFVAFARVARGLCLRTTLKAYLCTAVANRVCSLQRQQRQFARETIEPVSDFDPVREASLAEQLALLDRAMGLLPVEQREVVVLRLQSGLKFREIARIQGISTNTALTRYRYGLEKLRDKLDKKIQ